MNDVESGNIDAVKDTNSTTVDTSLPESKPILKIISFSFFACLNTNQVIFRLHKINGFFYFFILTTP